MPLKDFLLVGFVLWIVAVAHIFVFALTGLIKDPVLLSIVLVTVCIADVTAVLYMLSKEPSSDE